MTMTTVGLVGGLGPESTIDYYRRLIAAWEQIFPGSAPSLVIDSLDAQHGLSLAANDRAGYVAYLLGSLRRLAGAGVDFAVLTANTPHLVFDELAAQSPMPLLSIVETCAAEASHQGLTRLGLLGTRFTMEAPFFAEVFERHAIAVVSPGERDRVALHQLYVEQLLRGEFREETRRELIAMVERLRDHEHIDGVILGGTELTLLLRDETIAGLPTLNTTALHVAAIIERLR
jgi:aspartate racemase